jgi:hypothetical protein
MENPSPRKRFREETQQQQQQQQQNPDAHSGVSLSLPPCTQNSASSGSSSRNGTAEASSQSSPERRPVDVSAPTLVPPIHIAEAKTWTESVCGALLSSAPDVQRFWTSASEAELVVLLEFTAHNSVGILSWTSRLAASHAALAASEPNDEERKAAELHVRVAVADALRAQRAATEAANAASLAGAVASATEQARSAALEAVLVRLPASTAVREDALQRENVALQAELRGRDAEVRAREAHAQALASEARAASERAARLEQDLLASRNEAAQRAAAAERELVARTAAAQAEARAGAAGALQGLQVALDGARASTALARSAADAAAAEAARLRNELAALREAQIIATQNSTRIGEDGEVQVFDIIRQAIGTNAVLEFSRFLKEQADGNVRFLGAAAAARARVPTHLGLGATPSFGDNEDEAGNAGEGEDDGMLALCDGVAAESSPEACEGLKEADTTGGEAEAGDATKATKAAASSIDPVLACDVVQARDGTNDVSSNPNETPSTSDWIADVLGQASTHVASPQSLVTTPPSALTSTAAPSSISFEPKQVLHKAGRAVPAKSTAAAGAVVLRKPSKAAQATEALARAVRASAAVDAPDIVLFVEVKQRKVDVRAEEIQKLRRDLHKSQAHGAILVSTTCAVSGATEGMLSLERLTDGRPILIVNNFFSLPPQQRVPFMRQLLSFAVDLAKLAFHDAALFLQQEDDLSKRVLALNEDLVCVQKARFFAQGVDEALKPLLKRVTDQLEALKESVAIASAAAKRAGMLAREAALEAANRTVVQQILDVYNLDISRPLRQQLLARTAQSQS